MADRKIIAELIADDSKFNRTMDGAGKKAGGFGNVVKGVGMGIGTAAFDLAAGAVSSFVGALGEAKAAYQDDQTSQKLLQTALKNNIAGWDGSTAAIEKYAGAQGKFGFSDDEVRASIGQLIGTTHDEAEAMKLNTLAQELARAKGIDLAQATDLVTKASLGNGKALKALGIDLGDAKTGAEMLDKVQQNVKGSAEAWADTADGRAAAAAVRQGESWEKIGAVVSKLSDAILPVVTVAFETIADVISNVTTALEPVISSIITELTPAFQTVSAFLSETVIPILTSIVKTVFPPIKAAVGFLGDAFRTWFGVISTVVGTEIAIVSNIIGAVVTVVSGLGKAIGDVAGVIGGAVGNIVGFFTGMPDRIGAAVGGLFDGIWQGFKNVINLVIDGWNSLQFGIGPFDVGPAHFEGVSVGTPKIPRLHKGGVVPGARGSEVPIIAQAGEVVSPTRAGPGAQELHFHFGMVIATGADLDRLADMLAERVRLTA